MAITTKQTNHPVNPITSSAVENEAVIDQLETVRLKKGERIFDQEKTIARFFLVRQGLLGIFRHVYPNKKVLVHKIGPNESTGLAQAMSNRPFPGQLVPIKETVAFKGTQEDINVLCENYAADVSRLLADENKMLDDTVHKIDDIIGKDLETRIAEELIDLASRIGRETDDGIKIIVKLTRNKVSDMLGCAPESVIRVMSEWEKKGWISTNNGYITIHELYKLDSI